MTTSAPPAPTMTLTPDLAPAHLAADVASAIARACDRIAPAWPLDRLIAVNPFWGFVDAPMEQATARVTALSGATLLMPRAWYRTQWEAGRFAERHLAAAIARAGSPRQAAEVLAALQEDEPPPPAWRLMTDAADVGRDLGHAMAWGEFVTRHVSQTCAACFDEGQARWTPERSAGLYPLWRDLAVYDNGPRLLMGLRGFRKAAGALPADPRALIAEALAALEVPPQAWEGYLTALLLSVNGWASACAFRRWEARLAGSDDDQLVHLLAVRLAWELVLYRLGDPATLPGAWRAAQWAWTSAAGAAELARRDDWLVQHALEIAYQEGIARGLSAAPAATPAPAAPTAQAVFCIDVRSEVFRRAVERAAPSVQTLGFAGFFGLPIAYQPLAGPARAQLPGLLAPALVVEDAGPDRDAAAAEARRSLGGATAWKGLGGTAASTFSFVESAGLAWAASLVRDGLGLGRGVGDPLRAPAAGHAALRPTLARRSDGGALELPARVALAAGILRAMSLTGGFAPVLALVGHGASTENNPLAAGLHCGACGGQTGEVNARALAALLNDPAVRAGLAAEGIDLGDTHVVGGLHDTTLDEVTLYDLDRVPPARAADVAALASAFAAAGRGARRERAAALGLDATAGDDVLERSVRTRARDWAEVRPEWGLAGNAAFVVAPRERTRGLDLGGRSFLHDYRWEQDAGFKVLELILTAPMVVTH